MDDFAIALSGGRWDGLHIKVPYTAESVWMSQGDSSFWCVDTPIATLDPLQQHVYAITAQHDACGATIATYVKPPQETKA